MSRPPFHLPLYNVEASVVVQQKQTYAKFPTIPKVGQPHRRDRGGVSSSDNDLGKNKQKTKKADNVAQYPPEREFRKSFPPTGSDQGLQVVNRRSRTISPTRRPRGSVVFRWGRACRGRQSAVSREHGLTLLHVSPSSQSCLPSIGKSMLIHSEVELLLSGFIV